MPPLLIISRSRPDLLTRFQAAFADSPDVTVMLDRRVGSETAPTERRRWEVQPMLTAYGWALVGEEAAPAQKRPGSRRILIADDHEDTRHLLEWVLRRSGHEVMHADDGTVAIAKARAWHPDLAIIDMFMPEKDGMEVIRALRMVARPPKILAISAGWRAGGVRVIDSPNDLDILDDATSVGADAVLAKPIDPKALLAAVQKLLDA
jgi:CheY-like chemotaxis protein